LSYTFSLTKFNAVDHHCLFVFIAIQYYPIKPKCVFAEFSMAPLKALYAKNLKSGDFGYIPEERRVGLLDP